MSTMQEFPLLLTSTTVEENTATLNWHLDEKPPFREIEIFKEIQWKLKEVRGS